MTTNILPDLTQWEYEEKPPGKLPVAWRDSLFVEARFPPPPRPDLPSHFCFLYTVVP
jgi:hypothetical protein